jgi:hypothetical protein
MFRKIVDVLKEVFWIKPSRKKIKAARIKKPKKPVAKKPIAKKKIAKKSAKPAPLPKPRPVAKAAVAKKAAKALVSPIDPSLTETGVITHYFERIKVCVVKLTQGTVLIGDKLTIIGPKTKFVQKVWSMQIESEDVKVAKKGQLIGIKVDKLVVVGDKVYK